MARIVFGAETMEREHVIMGLANANSPMSWDFNMLGSAKVYAENNQIMLDHAVHPRRRDGAGDGRRAGDPDAGRGAGRDGVLPDRPARRAGHLRLVRVVDVDADRGADVRHARSRSSSCSCWPRSPAGSASRSAAAATSRRPSCPTTRRPTRARSASWRRCRPASTSTSTPPAGSRAASRSATRSSSSTRTRRRWPRPTSAGVDTDRQRLRARRDARRRAGPALPGLAAHAGQLRARVLALRARRTTTASSSGSSTAGSMRAQRANLRWKQRLAEYEMPPLDEGDPRGARRVDGPAQARASRDSDV